MTNKVILSIVVLVSVLAIYTHQQQSFKSQTSEENYIWSIRSIDTMKTSRDKARAELNNPQFDSQIKKELKAIKETGANYVAIGTPYDKEFLPYLNRWVKYARDEDLKVWFRGNWSTWEGWFDYPKTMTPQEHLAATRAFILTNKELFEDGDIFDSCPECENAGHWVQPARNKEYNEFIRAQAKNNAEAFKTIDKNVHANYPSIIGGRAKEVLDTQSVRDLGNVVTIDHYVSDKKFMKSYLDYFKDMFGANVIVSEFGAPIPDLNGEMTEAEQADFINNMFELLYARKDVVIGVNYYVSTLGTTKILNDDFSPRESYQVVKDYYSPAIIKGNIKNTLGENASGFSVKTADGNATTQTDEAGSYTLVIPPQKVTLQIMKTGYKTQSTLVAATGNNSINEQNFTVEPINPEFIYNIRLFLNKIP